MCAFHPWVMKIHWRKKWQHTPILLPGKFHGQRSLAGYSPWGCKTLDTTKHAQLSTNREAGGRAQIVEIQTSAEGTGLEGAAVSEEDTTWLLPRVMENLLTGFSCYHEKAEESHRICGSPSFFQPLCPPRLTASQPVRKKHNCRIPTQVSSRGTQFLGTEGIINSTPSVF